MNIVEEKDSKNNGRWTKIQHEKFLLGLQLFGKNWKKIQQLVGSRSGAQIRSHAQKFFLKSKNPGDAQDLDSNTLEPLQSQQRMSVISKQISEPQSQNQQYSYYLNKIIKITSNMQTFNFWNELIDVSYSKNEQSNVCQQEIKRKDSFVSFDLCNDSKQETTLSGINMLAEGIL